MAEREAFRPEIGPALPADAPAMPAAHAPEIGGGAFTPDAGPPPALAVPPPRRSRLGLLGLAGALLLLGALLLDWLLSLAAGRPLLAALGWAGLALLLLALAGMAWREWAALRALEEVAALRHAPGEAPDAAAGRLAAFGHRLAARGVVAGAAVDAWGAGAREQGTAEEVARGFARQLLPAADARALDAVARAARGAGVLVMVSPSPAADLALFTWRALRMLREVAVAYGLRPGRAAELRLLRRALAEGALMAGADIAADTVAATTGQLLSLAAGRAAEAALGGQRMARLGLLVIAACRPVPHAPGEGPGMAQVLGRAVGVGG